MKTCPNCRVVYGDDYAGSCVECGAPMGGVRGSTQGGLQSRYSRQLQQGEREASQEQALKRGRNDGLTLEQSIIDKAREFVSYDPSKVKYVDDGS